MYRILAQRSAASVFGAATAHLKCNGEVLTFATRAEAEAYIGGMRPFPRNLSYRVVYVKDKETA